MRLHRAVLLSQAVVAAAATTLSLFQPWNASQWVASDDSARPGGLSRSNLEVLPPNTPDNPSGSPVARFSGTLDYEALNGSGFASRRTADDWPGLDLAAFDGVVLEVPYSDGRTYTLNIKDTVAPPAADGRERASVSWEHDFVVPAAGGRGAASPGGAGRVVVRFRDLVPTYQGRVQNDTAPLNLTAIKRVNFMIRR